MRERENESQSQNEFKENGGLHDALKGDLERKVDVSFKPFYPFNSEREEMKVSLSDDACSSE